LHDRQPLPLRGEAVVGQSSEALSSAFPSLPVATVCCARYARTGDYPRMNILALSVQAKSTTISRAQQLASFLQRCTFFKEKYFLVSGTNFAEASSNVFL